MIRDATQRQRVVYEWMLEFQERHGMPPTLREICERFEYRSTNSAGTVLDALQKKGLVESSSSGRARGRRAVATRHGVTLTLDAADALTVGRTLRALATERLAIEHLSESTRIALGRVADRMMSTWERVHEGAA